MNSKRLLVLYIPIVLFLMFTRTYLRHIPRISYSYWDEMLWVGRSYFFDFFVRGDFTNNAWKTYQAYDQPKLTEYAYGAWLYPLYLKEQSKRQEQGFDYTKFLIINGFYEVDERFEQTYRSYLEEHAGEVANFLETDDGFREDYRGKYGDKSLKTLDLISHARTINAFLLSGAVVAGYYILLRLGGLVPALVFSLSYGFNILLVTSGLKAHAEGLFVLLFNASLLAIIYYFTHQNRLRHVILFSILAGLTVSTKLNGIMVLISFIVLNLPSVFRKNSKKIRGMLLSHMFLSIVLSLLIFVNLNPYTFSSPVTKVQDMFDWRMATAGGQANLFQSASLPTPASRITQIFDNFYNPERISSFNAFLYAESRVPYSWVLFVLFLGGITSEVIRIKKDQNKAAIILLVNFFLVLAFMSYYLLLDWNRYYAHLVFFFVYYQSMGLIFYATRGYALIKPKLKA
ncbi:MAG: hypothetical protein Q7S76_01140 [bacterium]|nr:hypothetical protein [bacterium]